MIACKRTAAVSVLLLLLTAGCQERTTPSVDIYFSPHGGCTDAVVRELDSAQHSVLVQAYSFTSTPIAKALVEARHRGVEVKVLLDRSQETEEYSSATFLNNSGIAPLVDAEHPIAHNKIMIIDGQTVVTGSFNFTKQAEQGNAENLLVIRDPHIAQQYADNWQAHAAHCHPYQPKPPESRSERDENRHAAVHAVPKAPRGPSKSDIRDLLQPKLPRR